MKTILFDPKTGMLDAVKNGTKTQTSRKLSKRPHNVGDVLAVAEPFWIVAENREGFLSNDFGFVSYFMNVMGSYSDKHFKFGILDSWRKDVADYFNMDEEIKLGNLIKGNRQGFPTALAETFIKIKSVAIKKPCDFTDEEYLAEGVKKGYYPTQPNERMYFNYGTKRGLTLHNSPFDNPKYSFFTLLQSINGKKKGEEIFNAECLVYTFELCDREGNTL